MEATESSKYLTEERSRGEYPKAVKVWLIIGIIMVFFQVVIGGITRLTESGLSITEWEVVTGTLPPLNEAGWAEEFEAYKATPQYEKINEGMTMSEFKFIYFWEYIHRLWARLMGFVFAIPFLIFWRKGMIDKPLMKRLGIVVLLAALAASFGWIMVKSGLEDRPWVNAYKLTMHLSIALVLFSYLLWTVFIVVLPSTKVIHNRVLKKYTIALTVVLALQLILGGIMSGMKAGLNYPTWPDMNGEWIPSILLDPVHWNVDNFVNYDSSSFMSALVQVLHRSTAYLLVIMSLWYFFRGLKVQENKLYSAGLYMLISVLVIQVILGILTVINCKGSVPVDLGVYHQAGALILLSVVLFLNYQFRKKEVA